MFPVFKCKPQVNIAATLESFATYLANAETTVNVRLSENFH